MNDYYIRKTVLFTIMVLFAGTIGINNLSAQDRVTADLQVLYEFREGTGTTISDVSGVGTALNLNINTPGAVQWTDNSLIVNANASILTPSAATKIYSSVTSTNQISIEAWIRPATLTYPNAGLPSRIISMSDGWYNRNFTLGQGRYNFGANSIDIRLRTTSTGINGSTPSVYTNPGTISTDIVHVVYTFSAGWARIYLDGSLAKTQFIGGNLSNWNAGYPMILANELSGDRPWYGEFFLVAIYNRELSLSEVQQNYNAGYLPSGPTITLQPEDQSVYEGEPAQFQVEASGDEPLSYQWQKNETSLPGEINNILLLDPTTLAMSGSYRCVVTDINGGSTTSNSALLTVNPSPEITQQPSNQIVYKGGGATFQVQAAGFPPLQYQWQKEGSNIVGEISNVLTIDPTTLADNGEYRCIVTDGNSNTAISNTVILTVNDSPVITQQPQDQSVAEGQDATFTVVITGAVPFTYQWTENGTSPVGGNSNVLTVGPTTLGDNGNTYQCSITDNFGNNVISNQVTLTVGPSPVINQQPEDQTVWVGQTATFEVVASGNSPFTYQWLKNGITPVGGNSGTLNLGPVSIVDNGSNYRCLVTDAGSNSQTSDPANLTVNPTPVITLDPENITVFQGEDADFSIEVTGAAPFTFEWRINDVPVSPPNNSNNFTFASVQLSNDGDLIKCAVTDDIGNTAESREAVLTVNASPVITQQPLNQSVGVGQVAVFTVTATGLPPLTYQWKVGGVNIPGANNDNYSTDPVTLDDDGKVYTCLIKDGDLREVTSESAVLNVVNVTWELEFYIVDDNGHSDMLKMGQSPLATDGIDPFLDEEDLPPPPPGGTFDTRFLILGGSLSSKFDYRNSSLGFIEWRLNMLPSTNGYPVTVTWDPADLPPGGEFIMKDPITGAIVNINMRNLNNYSHNGGFDFVIIEYTNSQCVDITVSDNWNLISVPFMLTSMNKDDIFPSSISNAFSFSNLTGYVIENDLLNGRGYWLKFDSPEIIQLCGEVSNNEILLENRWNLIGVFGSSVPVASINTTPPGIIISAFWGFDGGYNAATILEPGQGYWVKTNQAGIIYLNSAAIKGSDEGLVSSPVVNKNWGRVIVEDANNKRMILYIADNFGDFSTYELPPVPPDNIFDVRYDNNNIVISENDIGHLVINSAEYPIKIRADGVTFRIKDRINGNFVNQILEQNSEIVVSNRQIKHFEIMKVGLQLEYELAQNYPNPFNPSTKISYSLPKEELVTLDVYNTVGEKLATLVNMRQDAGKHEVEFDAANLASGVYFYRITAGSFMQTMKMILLR